MIRGRNRLGPAYRGPKRKFRATQTAYLPTNVNFAASIWTTLVVQKRQGLNRSFKTKTQLITVRKFPVVVTTVRVKPIKVVSLIKFQRAKPKTIIDFISKFGQSTTKVKPSAAKKVVFATNERMKRRFVVADNLNIKHFGKPTTAPQPSEIKVHLQRFIAKRVVTKTQLGKPSKQIVVVITVRPQKIRTILQALNRRKIVASAKLGKVKGKTTRKPKVVPPHILQFVAQQAMRKSKFVLGKHELSSPIVIAVVTGSTVVFYDGLSVADGLTYHQGLQRPNIILISVGGGKYTVIKSGSLSDEDAAIISKETYLIDGNLP